MATHECTNCLAEANKDLPIDITNPPSVSPISFCRGVGTNGKHNWERIVPAVKTKASSTTTIVTVVCAKVVDKFRKKGRSKTDREFTDTLVQRVNALPKFERILIVGAMYIDGKTTAGDRKRIRDNVDMYEKTVINKNKTFKMRVAAWHDVYSGKVEVSEVLKRRRVSFDVIEGS